MPPLWVAKVRLASSSSATAEAMASLSGSEEDLRDLMVSPRVVIWVRRVSREMVGVAMALPSEDMVQLLFCVEIGNGRWL